GAQLRVGQALALPGQGAAVVVEPAFQHGAFVGVGGGFTSLGRHDRILADPVPGPLRVFSHRACPAALPADSRGVPRGPASSNRTTPPRRRTSSRPPRRSARARAGRVPWSPGP